MKPLKTRILALLLAALMCLPCLSLPAGAAPSDWNGVLCVCGGNAVRFQEAEGETWLFLPASADLHRLSFVFQDALSLTAGETTLPLTSGTPVDLAGCFPQAPDDGIYPVEFRREGAVLPVKLVRSENIAALFLTSADPLKDRSWVELDRGNKAKGSAVLMKADGTVLYDGALKQIKGRGNSTWVRPKKPYQIKLDKAADLMECGEPDKTWVLLANHLDQTLLRNRITFDLAAELGMPYSPLSRPVDLYYDGEYRGSYLLSEKTEIGSSRVDIRDLEKAYEKANPEVTDFDSLTKVKGRTAAGCACQYVEGLTDPEDLSGGYLLEIDYSFRAQQEASWFASALDQYFTVKSPEYASRASVDYISTLWQTFENAVVAGGTDPATGRTCGQCMDLTSLARLYLILELAMEGDAFLSSTYFYKPEGEELLYAGPVWDYDSSYRVYSSSLTTTSLAVAKTALGHRLLAVPEIRQAVKEENGTLHRLVSQILLSPDAGAHGERLRSLRGYAAEIEASRRMDQLLWFPGQATESWEKLSDFLAEREPWLTGEIAGWQEGGNDTVAANGFLDVPRDAWYAESVAAVVDRGLFRGVGGNLFAPNETMTRSMVTGVLYRMAGSPGAAGEVPFRDVAPELWYADAAAWAAEQGVVSGYPDGTFRPNDPVTRQEFVALLYRYASVRQGELPPAAVPDRFMDRSKVPAWAEDAFGWAVESGLVNGSVNERNELFLDPLSQTPRCQGAALFLRFLQYLEAAPAGPADPSA